jgi:tRNA A-37 threonylcarbamoyl transferase component Bud32/tetratricopeptide (TPR) repeat protein
VAADDSTDQPSGAKRAAIEAILHDVTVSVRRGVGVDFEALEREHVPLMPELGECLAGFRAVQAAAEQAKGLTRGTGLSEAPEPTPDEQIEFLREAMTRYDILERIHQGGQGVVYKAVQRSTKRLVALKVLLDGPLASQRQRYRFEREVELISRLRHSQVVTVYDSGVVRGRQYFAMEFVEGLPIDDYVLLHRLSVGDTVELVQSVCEAVSAAHQRGVIHRDLKPSNILVDMDGVPHILDFGLAKDITGWSAGEGALSVSMDGRVVGTLPYLSPEQAAGLTDHVDVRSDIYSLGVVLFELITGCFPYPVEGDPQTVRDYIQSREAVALRVALSEHDEDQQAAQVDDDLEKVVHKCLEKDKAQRYQSAEALATDLRHWLAGEAVEAKAASHLYLLRKTLRRYRVHATIAATLMVILVGALIGVTMAWQRADRIARIGQAGLQMGAFIRVGTEHRQAGRLDQAIAMLEKVLEIGDHVSESDPFVLRHVYDAHHHLAEVYIKIGRTDEAASHCEASVRMAEQLVATEPEELRWRRFLAISHELRGRVALAQKDSLRAYDAFEAVIRTYRRLLSLDPESTQLKSDLAFGLGLQGKCCRRLKRYDESLRRTREAYEIYWGLHEADPDAVGFAVDLARMESRLAVWHLSQHTEADDQTASDWLKQADDRLTQLQATGRAASHASEISGILDAVRTNQKLVLSRAEARAAGQP